MYANSRPVSSDQTCNALRTRLLVHRHRQHDYLRPIAVNNQRVFEALHSLLALSALPLILDSGCGDGASTVTLAGNNPQALVIGIDKSAHRLRRYALDGNIYRQGNLILARADVVDIWRLAAAAGWSPQRHVIYYPNPWPKQKHRSRRWYAHLVFPFLMRLGGELEVRSNWSTYIREFSSALQTCNQPHRITTLTTRGPDSASPFERKYLASGHDLLRLTAWLQQSTNQHANLRGIVTEASRTARSAPAPLHRVS